MTTLAKNRFKVLLSIPYAISLFFIAIPFISFIIKALDKSFVAYDIVLDAIKVSLYCNGLSLIFIILIGIPSAFFMARYDFKYKFVLDTLLNIPMVLPPAVAGLILLLTFGSKGVVGKHLLLYGVDLSFSSTAVIITLIFVSLPLFINGVTEGFKSIDRDLEITAQTLGDSPLKCFFKITMPLAKSSIFASALTAWARSMGEFGATMMFGGNIKGTTQTLPLAIYTALESSYGASMFMSLIMIILSFIIVLTAKIISSEKGMR